MNTNPHNADWKITPTQHVEAAGDVVLVPRGHHPCGAPYGFEMYYLNVMAGPLRKWRSVPATEVEWLMQRDT